MSEQLITLEDKLSTDLEAVEDKIVELLQKHSGIGEDINSKYSGMFTISGADYPWKNLDINGINLQNIIRSKFQQVAEILQLIVSRLSPAHIERFEELKGSIESQFEQRNKHSRTCYATISKSVESVQVAFAGIRAILAQTPTQNKNLEGQIIAVTDTCSLLQQHELHAWKFENIKHCTLVIVPQVIAELDRHKDGGKEQLAKKAASLILQLKEFRSRGALSGGVKINNTVWIKITTSEDLDMPISTWLKPDNADDKILISALQLACLNFRSDVRVITRDTNVSNKLHLLGIGELEPAKSMS